MQPSILITGCSSGIGYAAAHALKQRGYRVFAAARKAADVEKLTTEGLEAVLLDVTDNDSIAQALSVILDRTNGSLDALFNNAGYLQAGAIEDITQEMERAQFETNVFGSIELTRRTLRIMRKQGHGRIIQNSSILGVVAIPYCGAYNASKYAIEGFFNTLRLELRNTPIHVSLINPGPIASRLRQNAHKHYEKSLKAAQTGHYQQQYEKLEKYYFNANQSARTISHTPDIVTKALVHALESKHPSAHYYVGITAKTLAILRRILPDFALDWLLANSR